MKDILFKLNKPITLKEGTGVTLTNNGITGTQVIDGTNTSNVQVSIGQSVSTSSNVQFNNVVLSSDSLTVGTGSDTLVFSDGKLVGDVTFQQNVENTEDLTSIGNLVYTDSVTATTIITGSSQVTQSVITGSNIFGGTLSDNQFFTGSFDTTGSIKLNGSNTITEISNDINATDQSQTSFVTEYAAYEFLTGQSTEGLYLRKSFVHTGSFVNSSTSSFNAITASAPQTLTGTTENDFMFFINGMLVENDALTIEQKASTNLELRLDTSSLGYELSAQDEIIGFGKFNN
tara:strand:+ start:150 stop:1013 length:864 start_codon:yes stop_codon:yes gene_type:complete